MEIVNPLITSITKSLSLIALLLSVNAHSQLGETMPPPSSIALVDARGVDMLSGTVGIPGMSVSIGGETSGIMSNPGRERYMNDNFTGTLTKIVIKNPVNDPAELLGLSAGTYVRVDSVGFSEIFRENGLTYTNAKNTGGILSCSSAICTYTTRDGTVVELDKTKTTGFEKNYGVAAYYSNLGQQTKITRPDGEVIQLTYIEIANYRQHMISAVNSSLGWMLKYYFGPKITTQTMENGLHKFVTTSDRSIKAINLSVEYCNASAPHCNNLQNDWPTSSMVGKQDLRWNPLNAASTWQIVSSEVTNPAGKTDYYSDTIFDPPASGTTEVYRTPAGVGYSFYKPGCAYVNGSCITTSIQGKVNLITMSGGYTFNYYWNPVSGPDGSYLFNNSRLLQHTDKLGRTYRQTYADSWGLLIDKVIDSDATPSVENPTGGYTDYDYDSRGNITKISVFPKYGGTPLVTTATYPSTCSNMKTCNKPLTITDEKGVTTSYEYSPIHGGVISETKPANNGIRAQVRYGYSQVRAYFYTSQTAVTLGTPVWRLTSISKCMTMTLATCVGTNDENIIKYLSHDSNGQPRQIVQSTGLVGSSRATYITHDIYGNVIASHTSGYRTTYFYDAMQRVIGKIQSDVDGIGLAKNIAKRISYNDDGKIYLVETGTTTYEDSFTLFDIKEVSEVEYGVVGLPIVERYYVNGILERMTQKSYNEKLLLECVALRLNRSQFTAPPASACDLGPEGSEGSDRITKYDYDATGALLKITSALGTASERNDRVNTYDPTNGLLISEADGNGNKTFYKYDNFKRPWRTVFPSPSNGQQESTTDYIQTNYTGAFITSIRLRDGQLLNYNSYDSHARLTGVTGAVNENFQYNHFGFVTSHTATSGAITHSSSYTYSALGEMLTDTRYLNGVSLGTVSYDYDQSGNRTKLTWPDNFFVNYNYHNSKGIALQSITLSDGTVLASFDYDERARLKYLTRGNGVVTTYDYYDDNKIKSLSTDVGFSATADDIYESFIYTVSGQLKSKTLNVANNNYIYSPIAKPIVVSIPNALNQITTIDGIGLNYDRRGNLTCDKLDSQSVCSSTGTSYQYNAQNQLVRTTRSNVTTTLDYDAEGRLFGVTRNNASTRFMYDGNDLIAETDANNNILRRYVHHPQMNTPIAWLEDSGTTDIRYYTTDRLGSVVGITLPNGLSTSINAYDDYGIQRNSAIGRFQYTGQAWLEELGLYYFKSRFYSPSLGRFLQSDPIGYVDGMNWYAYVSNDPTNYFDPNGTNACALKDDPYCIDHPPTETPGDRQDPPSPEQEKVEEVLVLGFKDKKMSDGTKIRFPQRGVLEQVFKLSENGMYPMTAKKSGTQSCDDGSKRAASFIDISGLGSDFLGHTHGGGELNPLPGPEDGRAPLATNRTSYVISRAGAFGIEKTGVGFRVRQIAGKPLNEKQRAYLTETVAKYNTNSGGSGAKCSFTESK